MDKPKCWVKNVQLKVKVDIWVCPYLTQIWVKTTQHRLDCIGEKAVSYWRTFWQGKKPRFAYVCSLQIKNISFLAFISPDKSFSGPAQKCLSTNNKLH